MPSLVPPCPGHGVLFNTTRTHCAPVPLPRLRGSFMLLLLSMRTTRVGVSAALHSGPPVLIRQVSSGVCIHPFGGLQYPPDNTRLVLLGDCSASIAFRISYILTSDNLLVHSSSRQCAQPLFGAAPTGGTRLVLTGDCNPSNLVNLMVFVPQVVGATIGTLHHVSSGFCVQPSGGQITPDNDTALVLDPACFDGPGSAALFEFVRAPGRYQKPVCVLGSRREDMCRGEVRGTARCWSRAPVSLSGVVAWGWWGGAGVVGGEAAGCGGGGDSVATYSDSYWFAGLLLCVLVPSLS